MSRTYRTSWVRFRGTIRGMPPAALVLMYFVVPLWLAAGVADYACHRGARIEETSGVRENLLHFVQFGAVGLPVVAALFLEMNALLFAGMIAALATHQAVAFWDVRYAASTRTISPLEQQVHSLLEILPLTALLLLAALHWPQILALFGAGQEAASWSLGVKTEPLPVAYRGGVLVAAAAIMLLYAEEFFRCLRRR